MQAVVSFENQTAYQRNHCFVGSYGGGGAKKEGVVAVLGAAKVVFAAQPFWLGWSDSPVSGHTSRGLTTLAGPGRRWVTNTGPRVRP
ncbi:MAG: hypothetical protein V7646_396, partial [Pseudonocardia sp.]